MSVLNFRALQFNFLPAITLHSVACFNFQLDDNLASFKRTTQVGKKRVCSYYYWRQAYSLTKRLIFFFPLSCFVIQYDQLVPNYSAPLCFNTAFHWYYSITAEKTPLNSRKTRSNIEYIEPMSWDVAKPMIYCLRHLIWDHLIHDLKSIDWAQAKYNLFGLTFMK